MSSFEIISDYSKSHLKEIPAKVLDMVNLKMLFLERNFLTSLPDDFFYRLPNLMWLDLRNNQLESLPKSISHHEHLEHLLLTNNNIQKLPNELGLVPNLKALQITDNPIVYPPRKVIQEGTKAIKKYLNDQYEMACANNASMQKAQEIEKIKRELKEKERMMEMQEETVIKVHEKEASVASFERGMSKESFYSASNKLGLLPKSRESTTSNKRHNLDNLSRNFTDPKGLNPTLRVKKLDFPTNKRQEEPLKIIHSISKSRSKISLKSYYDRTGIKGNLSRIPENSLKEGWLNKLRILLNDQERILQQERNLKALTTWRQKRPSTPKTFYDSDVGTRLSEAPFATSSEYSKTPSRSELTSQLHSYLNDSDIVKSRPIQANINLNKLIDDLVQQLKEMESIQNDRRSPRSEVEEAGKQIQTIVEIHKKLLKLKSANDYM